MALTVFKIRRDVIASLRRRKPRIYEDLERTVASLRAFPHLFFSKPSVETLVVYLQGYDAALHGLPLEGFLYWLELKWNPGESPRHWIDGLPAVARLESGAPRSRERVFDAACAVLQRFFGYRRRYGTTRVTEEFMRRRGRQRAGRGQ